MDSVLWIVWVNQNNADSVVPVLCIKLWITILEFLTRKRLSQTDPALFLILLILPILPGTDPMFPLLYPAWSVCPSLFHDLGKRLGHIEGHYIQ